MLTTAMKIEINLVVTMMAPWLMDAIIDYQQHQIDGPTDPTEKTEYEPSLYGKSYRKE